MAMVVGAATTYEERREPRAEQTPGSKPDLLVVGVVVLKRR